jgi:hypothetical protein
MLTVTPRKNGSSVASAGPSSSALPARRKEPSLPTTAEPKTGEHTWQEIWSMEYQCTYFFCEVSGESQWEEPKVASQLIKRMDKSSDWVTCWSDKYSRSFYYNKKTKQSAWDDPLPANDDKPVNKSAASATSQAPRSRGGAGTAGRGDAANPRLFVVAQHNFTPQPGAIDEIELRAGEVVQVLDTAGGDEWWRGKRVRDGKDGLFPVAFTQWL